MRCRICRRYMKRLREGVGLPLLTGFPPDRPHTASSVPYAPFICENAAHHSLEVRRVQYEPVGFESITEEVT